MRKTRGDIEAGGARPSHLCGVLQSGGTGGALVRRRDIGPIDVNEEAVSGGTYGFLMEVDW